MLIAQAQRQVSLWCTACLVQLLYLFMQMQAKGLYKVEYRSEGVVINKYTLSGSHCSHSSQTTLPITEKYNDNSLTNGKTLPQEIIFHSAEWHDVNTDHKFAARSLNKPPTCALCTLHWASRYNTEFQHQEYTVKALLCRLLLRHKNRAHRWDFVLKRLYL